MCLTDVVFYSFGSHYFFSSTDRFLCFIISFYVVVEPSSIHWSKIIILYNIESKDAIELKNIRIMKKRFVECKQQQQQKQSSRANDGYVYILLYIFVCVKRPSNLFLTEAERASSRQIVFFLSFSLCLHFHNHSDMPHFFS